MSMGRKIKDQQRASAEPQNDNIMNGIVKKACLVLSVITLMPLYAGATKGDGESEPVDWDSVMEAIIWVESQGNPRAVSGNQVGAMQITPICVRECNIILESRGSKKRYTLSDRFDVKKSKEMFLLVQSKYNKTNNVEKAIRSWNGGPNYSVKATNRYYKKVMERMK
jgi:hypothetical protein